MSITARMLVVYADALRRGDQPQHTFSWEHCARLLAQRLIGEGA